VTVGGRAADAGVVRFVPLGDESGAARGTVTAVIAGGQYQIQADGGLQKGQYRVEVEVQEKTGKKIMADIGPETAEIDEVVLVSSRQHAGPDSPLNYTPESRASGRFDIDVPGK